MSRNSTGLRTAAAVGTAVAGGVLTWAIARNDRVRHAVDIAQDYITNWKAENENAKATDEKHPADSPRVLRPRQHAEHWLEVSEDPELELNQLVDEFYTIQSNMSAAYEQKKISEAFRKAADLIDRDIERTMPLEPLLQSPLRRRQLRNVLRTYALYDPDVGYVQGMNYLVAFILMHLVDPREDCEIAVPPQAASNVQQSSERGTPALASTVASNFDMQEAITFTLLVRLMWHPRYHMRGLYTQDLPDVACVSYQLTELMQQFIPDVANKLHEASLDPVYFFEWYFTLFTYMLPRDVTAEIWDDFFEMGWTVVFRVIMALLKILEPLMLETDPDSPMELIAILKAFQNHCNQHMLSAAANNDVTPSQTRGEKRAGLNSADVDPEWEAIDSQPSLSGTLRLPPPPNLLETAHQHFEGITPQLVSDLRASARRRLASIRRVQGDQQTYITAQQVREQTADSDETVDSSYPFMNALGSWLFVRSDIAFPEELNEWTSRDGISRKMHQAREYVLSSLQRVSLRDTNDSSNNVAKTETQISPTSSTENSSDNTHSEVTPSSSQHSSSETTQSSSAAASSEHSNMANETLDSSSFSAQQNNSTMDVTHSDSSDSISTSSQVNSATDASNITSSSSSTK